MTMTPAQPLHKVPELINFIERLKLLEYFENSKMPIKGAYYELSPKRGLIQLSSSRCFNAVVWSVMGSPGNVGFHEMVLRFKWEDPIESNVA